jgi:hypothetical protein
MDISLGGVWRKILTTHRLIEMSQTNTILNTRQVYVSSCQHISLIEWGNATRTNSPLFIEMNAPRLETICTCMCVLGVSMLSLFLRFFYQILELFRLFAWRSVEENTDNSSTY